MSAYPKVTCYYSIYRTDSMYIPDTGKGKTLHILVSFNRMLVIIFNSLCLQNLNVYFVQDHWLFYMHNN